MKDIMSRQYKTIEVRDNHLRDPLTSRDLLGIVRGRCINCKESCGKYIIDTKRKYYRHVEEDGRDGRESNVRGKR